MSWAYLPKELESKVVGEISTTSAIKEKQNKYKVSEKTDRTYNNITFASKKEMKRYKKLLMLEKAGEIFNLQLQPQFLLQEGFKYIGKKYKPIMYVGDFSYSDGKKAIVEDCKGFRTRVYMLKKKLLLPKLMELNIEFRET